MNKKLMAVAVAGALVAPAVASAQSSVQVFGTLYGEYSFINQGPSTAGVDLANPDVLQTPGSEIGFKGEEKLGGGMSAWFQCASTADFRGQSQDGFCGRNSAVGLKGSFGNVFVGVWDTPFKRARVGNVGGRDTGVFGTAFLMYGGSTTVGDGANTGVFARRQQNSINYDSPNFNGFQVMAAMSSTNSATNDVSGAANAKPRVVSVAGTYRSGALALGVGYSQQDKIFATGGDEKGWHLSAAYTIGSVKIGGAYTNQEWDPTAATSGEVDAWHLGVEWKLGGPHMIAFGYTQADDIDGNSAAVTGQRAASGVNTGAKLWQIRYQHDLSKRTWVGGGYVRLNNEANAVYDLGGFAAGAGADQKGFALQVGHRF